MHLIIAAIPILHIVAVLLLTLLYLARSMALICNKKNTYSKAAQNAASFITLMLFFSGIIQGFLLKIPFSSSFILIKIVGLLLITGLSVAAFMPRRKKTTALAMMAFSFITLIAIIFVSKLGLYH